MTLDEAIKHCEEKAEELNKEVLKQANLCNAKEVADCQECARDHEQLSEWLKELKAYKEASNNDLISRTELKKCAIPCEIHNGALTDLCVPLYQIDNAPTVEYTFEEAFQKTVCEQRLYCPARPKGEWNYEQVAFYGICSNCGVAVTSNLADIFLYEEIGKCPYNTNFCPNCGADMRGEEDANT